MFGIFTDVAKSGLDVIGDLMDGKETRREDIATLIDAGLTVAAISEMTGLSVEIIDQILKDQ